MQLKITKKDGTVIEAEGTFEEIKRLFDEADGRQSSKPSVTLEKIREILDRQEAPLPPWTYYPRIIPTTVAPPSGFTPVAPVITCKIPTNFGYIGRTDFVLGK